MLREIQRLNELLTVKYWPGWIWFALSSAGLVARKPGEPMVKLPAAKILHAVEDEKSTKVWDRQVTWWTPCGGAPDFPPLLILACPLPGAVAVGTIIADRHPHRSVRAALPHTAPTLDHGVGEFRRGCPSPLSSAHKDESR